MKSMQRALGNAAWLWVALLAGCAARPKAEAPASAPATEMAAPGAPGGADEPQTLAEAEARLDRARADLDQLALNDAAAPPAAAGAAAPTTAPAPPAPAPKAAAPRDEARAADKAEAEAPERTRANPVNACDTACKAFSSLSRASDAVCRLDSEGGKRCERARQIQQDASRRVASCGCSQ
jgi:hypothetical protein